MSRDLSARFIKSLKTTPKSSQYTKMSPPATWLGNALRPVNREGEKPSKVQLKIEAKQNDPLCVPSDFIRY